MFNYSNTGREYPGTGSEYLGTGSDDRPTCGQVLTRDAWIVDRFITALTGVVLITQVISGTSKPVGARRKHISGP